ncbi:MAG: DUF1638 domain-containing protein [Flavobacteriaceae bacterium]
MDAPTASPEPEKLLVIACGMIARETLAVVAQGRLDHIEVTALPAIFHHYPDRIAPAAEKAIEEARAAGYRHIFMGYADCGTGGALDAVCARHGVERIAGPHCFAFYQGNAAFEAMGDDDMRCFYMTDFLARQFEAFLMKPLGLDRHPELRDMYFGHYEKLVYLAQTRDEALIERAKAAAETLGLEYEYRFTGYGDLADTLKALEAPAG